MTLVEQILKLAKQFYPTGRAFRMFFGGDFEKLNRGLATSEARMIEDARSILNSVLPDNDGFTTDDATDWERRLGLISNGAVSLADRKLAIKRKMNFPGTIPARQHYLYIEGQLQAAGFNVYVFRNIFPDGMGGYRTYDPFAITGGFGGRDFQHGQLQHGQFQHGGKKTFRNIIANHIEEALDSIFAIGSNYRFTFFIGGAYLGTYANVDADRKDEFRQLILKLKPAQEVGFLFINYV